MTTLALHDYRHDLTASAERATRTPLPSLSTLAVLDIARLFREQPDDALRLADESRRAFEAGRKAGA